MRSQNSRYIRAGYLIDGRGGPVRKQQLITIEAGRIVAITDAGSQGAVPAEQLTDLSHCVVLPVLIDSHVHLCMSGSIDPQVRDGQLDATYEDLIPVIAEHLRHQFSHGVLGLRDGGDRGGHVLRYLGEQSGGASMPVRVMSPGQAYHRCGRYGSLIGECLEHDESLPAAFLKRDQPATLVKVVNSGVNSLTSFARQTDPQFSVEQLRQLVIEARSRGLRVMVHANGEIPVRTAIEAGCDSIEHGFFMGRRNLELMAEKAIYWVPTVFTMKACVQNVDYYRSTIDKKVASRNFDHQLEQLALARELGVKVALGTDSGSIGVLHGESMVEEMKLFMQAGFSLSETISCASWHGARLLGWEETGSLEPGMPANFLAARGTPAQLPRKLTYLENIYLDGSPCEVYRRDPDYTTLRKYEGVAFSGKVKF